MAGRRSRASRDSASALAADVEISFENVGGGFAQTDQERKQTPSEICCARTPRAVNALSSTPARRQNGVEEDGTAAALSLRRQVKLIAPDLWSRSARTFYGRKTRRHDCHGTRPFSLPVSSTRRGIELSTTRSLLEAAATIPIELDHPAYLICVIAWAVARGLSLCDRRRAYWCGSLARAGVKAFVTG